MNAMKILLLVFLALGVSLAFVGCNLKSGYDRAIVLSEDVNSAWAQVENQLQRRYDLIPNLVESVKGIVGQEKDVFLGIADARKAYFKAGSGGVAAKAKAASGFESALSRLLVLRETYPELRSNQSFLKLQDTLEGTENRIGVERKRYNEHVKALNTFTRKLFGSIYASWARVEPAEYFQVAEAAKAVPKVDFGGQDDDE